MEEKVRIFGVDPGLHTCGYACLEVIGHQQSLLEAGVFRTSRSQAIERRLNSIATDIEQLLEQFRPDVVAVEQLYSHYRHPRTAILMGHARGVILQKVSQAGIEVRSFSATRIKKSITGNGQASKGQVQRSVQAVLGLAELPEPNDVADAVAAALCYANTLTAHVATGG